jgi:hypothetical protein
MPPAPRCGDDLGQERHVPHREHIPGSDQRSGQLDLVVVDVLPEALHARHDDRDMAIPDGREDAAYAGVGDHELAPLELPENLVEFHELDRGRHARRGQTMAMLHHQLLVRQRGQRAQEAAEWLLMSTDRDEDQSTLPA